MTTLTYQSQWDIIALDKVDIVCNRGHTPKNDFTTKYYDDWWWWKRKFETLLRLQDEFLGHEKTNVFQ